MRKDILDNEGVVLYYILPSGLLFCFFFLAKLRSHDLPSHIMAAVGRKYNPFRLESSLQRLVENPYLLSAGIGDHECILEYSACTETCAVLDFALSSSFGVIYPLIHHDRQF